MLDDIIQKIKLSSVNKRLDTISLQVFKSQELSLSPSKKCLTNKVFGLTFSVIDLGGCVMLKFPSGDRVPQVPKLVLLFTLYFKVAKKDYI